MKCNREIKCTDCVFSFIGCKGVMECCRDDKIDNYVECECCGVRLEDTYYDINTKIMCKKCVDLFYKNYI